MQTYEFSGRTPEEAIEIACRTLNISKDGMEIEIIEPGSAGIFGLVRSKKSIRGVEPFTAAEMEAVLELRGALANWAILLEGSRVALATAVSAIQSDSTTGATASFVATSGELQQAARQVRHNLAALGN